MTSLLGVDLTRACLNKARFVEVNAERAVLEFADLRNALFQKASFIASNMVGADLRDAVAYDVNFYKADFYWAYIDRFTISHCDTTEARWPDAAEIAFRPKRC